MKNQKAKHKYFDIVTFFNMYLFKYVKIALVVVQFFLVQKHDILRKRIDINNDDNILLSMVCDKTYSANIIQKFPIVGDNHECFLVLLQIVLQP